MARPVKLRCVTQLPTTVFFKPAGIPMTVLQRVRLSVEEIEALRLKDLLGLEQEECAQRMHISRPTFHRVLEAARRKIADALINGKAIQIEGGNFGLSQQPFRCGNDGHEWNVPFEVLERGISPSCPACSSMNVQPVPIPGFRFGRGCGRRFRGDR